MAPDPFRRGAFLALLVIALAGCRRQVYKLEDVQKVAYTSRPAVVRVNAVATARFRYTAETVRRAALDLKARGFDLDVPPASPSSLDVATGAGGSGSGFVIRP